MTSTLFLLFWPSFRVGIMLVKMDDPTTATEYGIEEDTPSLVYFENEIPHLYHGKHYISSHVRLP